jgi:hypothetical protein
MHIPTCNPTRKLKRTGKSQRGTVESSYRGPSRKKSRMWVSIFLIREGGCGIEIDWNDEDKHGVIWIVSWKNPLVFHMTYHLQISKTITLILAAFDDVFVMRSVHIQKVDNGTTEEWRKASSFGLARGANGIWIFGVKGDETPSEVDCPSVPRPGIGHHGTEARSDMQSRKEGYRAMGSALYALTWSCPTDSEKTKTTFRCLQSLVR